MSRSIRHLGSFWCRWQLMTSPLPAANRQLLSVARQRCPAVLGADRSRPSVRLFQRARRQCHEAASFPGPAGDDGGPGIAETLTSDGPGGTSAADQDESGSAGLADLDIGKTFIPPSSTDNLVFGGIPYYQLPVIHIKATYNNTHVNITDHTGRRSYTRTTCGAEGFKNAKKGTTIAAQTVGIAAATKALDKGLKTVRVVVKGIGPGRQASIKGLQMGGVDIVSITDNTPVPHNGCRPRKARRL